MAGPKSDAESWTEVRVEVPFGWQELVSEALCAGPCKASVIGAAPHGTTPASPGREVVRTYLLDSRDCEEARAEIRARLDALCERVGDPELSDLEPSYRSLPPEDYAETWRKVWKPFRTGRICVIPTWDERTLRDGDMPLRLEPGAVFGSGRHATTRTCLGALQGLVRPGDRVLDAGCGTGILSVAATMLGAESALGFDIDELARPAGNRLARDNGVGAACTFLEAGFECLEERPGPYDGVIANIYAAIIQEQAATLAASLAPGGWFLFSGCAAMHREPTERAIEAAGLRIHGIHVRGRWHTYRGESASS